MSFRNKAVLACLLILGASDLRAQDPAVIHVGIVDSLIKELSPGKQKILTSEFAGLVQDLAGYKSEVFLGGDAFTAAKKLTDGQWHLAVFQGIEFAWVQADDPKLQPLMAAIHRKGDIYAVLVVKKDSAFNKAADLKDKVAWIQPGKVHVQLFAEKLAQGSPDKFFSKVLTTPGAETPLDDILRGNIHAGILDAGALDDYRDINPGKFNRLRTLAKSELFPPTVVAYREGTLSDTALNKLKAGMFGAKKTQRGREAMANVQITAFETVPENFSQLLSSIRKAYPSPKK